MKHQTRFLIILCVTGILSALSIGGFSYWFQKQHIIREAKARSNLILDYINASSGFFEHNQKALVNELFHDTSSFYPELTNGFMLLREVSELFATTNTNHRFYLASLNPLNKKNTATGDERRIIEKFRSDPQLQKQEGLTRKDGHSFYYMASPVKVTGNLCLNCHGSPENAARAQVILYGTDSGYNWQQGDTIAAAIVRVSLQDSLREAKNTAMKLFFISFICFMLAFLALILFFDRG